MAKINFFSVIKSLIFFLLVIPFFFNHGLQQAQANEQLCRQAIGMKPFWDYSSPWTTKSVTKAKKLGFSERECARLTRRFSERQIRAASTKKSTGDQNKKDASRSAANESAIITLTNQISSLKLQLKNQNQIFKSLKRDTEAVAESLKGFQYKGNSQEELKSLDKEIQTRLNQFDRQSKETDEKYEKILTTIAKWQDVIPRIERKIKALENLGQAKKEKSISQSTEAPPLPSDSNPLDILIWAIPVLLLLCAFGIMIIVLARRNNEMKRQLEDRVRHANRHKPVQKSEEAEAKANSEDG